MTTYQLPSPKKFEHCLANKNTHLFHLTNRAGMQIALTDYGARLVSALVPNKHGDLVDVVLGFDSIHGYLAAQEKYHGATIGRVANRIANGKFELDGQSYTLETNNSSNSLHGGNDGFHSKVWDRQVSFKKKIDFYYTSPDGEAGFPGEVKVTTSYELSNENEIIIKFRATTDKPTIINLTNHAYFNLNGEGNGDVLNHKVQIHADKILSIDDKQIPTGVLIPVEGSAFDFRTEKKIVDDITSHEELIRIANGYDHSFINEKPLSQAIASAYAEESGITLEVFTDAPTLHLYSGNFLANDEGKSGHKYLTYGGLCFEAQHYIDAINQPHFPAIILSPDEVLENTIIYKFGIKK